MITKDVLIPPGGERYPGELFPPKPKPQPQKEKQPLDD